MRILVACEESQAVAIAFRKLGHRAYSCDIQECSGGHPEWHIQDDVLNILNGDCYFQLQTGEYKYITGRWDIIIGFPPCYNLAVSGTRYFERKRKDGSQLESIHFFMKILSADCDMIAVENPVNIIGGKYIAKWFPEIPVQYPFEYRNKDQIIQPYQFGHRARKTTCLWLKGLPKLEPTNIVDPGEILEGGYSVGASAHYATDENGKIIPWNDPRTSKIRSKTFQGIADAMADQWTKYLNQIGRE